MRILTPQVKDNKSDRNQNESQEKKKFNIKRTFQSFKKRKASLEEAYEYKLRNKALLNSENKDDLDFDIKIKFPQSKALDLLAVRIEGTSHIIGNKVSKIGLSKRSNNNKNKRNENIENHYEF